MRLPAKRAALLALIAAVLGLVFAAYSTYDYAAQLDRQVHAVHCSFIPGAPVSTDADNPCKTALFSPYSAVFRATWWGGGVPLRHGRVRVLRRFCDVFGARRPLEACAPVFRRGRARTARGVARH